MKIDCKFDGSKITRNYYKVQYLYIILNKQISLILSDYIISDYINMLNC